MHFELNSMPTIDQMATMYSAAYIDFTDTVLKSKDESISHYQLTGVSYDAFVKYLNVVNNLLQEARMKKAVHNIHHFDKTT